MARNKQLIIKEQKAIHEMFVELFSIKEFGVRKYNIDWIYSAIGEKFYKQPRTIREIISKPTPEE